MSDLSITLKTPVLTVNSTTPQYAITSKTPVLTIRINETGITFPYYLVWDSGDYIAWTTDDLLRWEVI